jgi:hypothetical protein
MLLALVVAGTIHAPSAVQAQDAGASHAPRAMKVQDSCRSSCWEAYGHCYKSTSNRQRCQALLQRCLDGCIRSRR